MFPTAGQAALFSDAVLYRFRLRRASIAATGPQTRFAVASDDEEIRIDCAFAEPDGSPDDTGAAGALGPAAPAAPPSSARAAPQRFLRPAGRGIVASGTGCFGTHASSKAPPKTSTIRYDNVELDQAGRLDRPGQVCSTSLLDAHCCARTSARSPYQ